MIGSTPTRILLLFVVLFIIGISSFFLLSQKPERHVDKQALEMSPIDSQDSSVQTASLLPGASDAEKQAYIDTLESSQISEETLENLSPSVLEEFRETEKELELVAAGKHPDYPLPPQREDFSSDLDYHKAKLEFFVKKLSEAEGTEYQETFESIIASIEGSIASEEAWISGAKERREEELWWKEQQEFLIKMNTDVAVLESLSEADQRFYLKYIMPNIHPDGELELSDEVLEKMLKETGDSAPSVLASDSALRPSVVAPRESVSVPIAPDQQGNWHEMLMREYPDIFPFPDAKSRDAMLKALPSEGSRQYFRERQTALHKEYAAVLDSQLQGMPQQKRAQVIATARQSLVQKWDKDFAESVINQLEGDDK